MVRGAISELAGVDGHYPDVDLRYGGVTMRLITITDGYHSLSEPDVELARQISAVARELGVPPDRPECRRCGSRSTRSSAAR